MSHFAYPFLSLQPQNWYQHCGLPLLLYFAFAVTLLPENAKRSQTLKLRLYRHLTSEQAEKTLQGREVGVVKLGVRSYRQAGWCLFAKT